MFRLYLTAEQARSVARALRHQVTTLNKCIDEMLNDGAEDIALKYANEADKLLDVLDILER